MGIRSSRQDEALGDFVSKTKQKAKILVERIMTT